jgi:hypothetical protein
VRGASALGDVLQRVVGRPVRVFVVWEPVLWTDLAPPTSKVLSLISDSRASQYWDKDLVVSVKADSLGDTSRREAAAAAGKKTVVWDVAAIFPPGARWDANFPSPTFASRPVITRIDEIQRRLSELNWRSANE